MQTWRTHSAQAVLALAASVLAASVLAACDRGPARTLALEAPGGFTALFWLTGSLDNLLTFSRVDDCFVGVVDVIDLELHDDGAAADEPVGAGYVVRPRWAAVTLRVYEPLRGHGVGDLAPDQIVRVALSARCPLLLREDGRGAPLEPTPHEPAPPETQRTWGRCDFRDPLAAGGPLTIELGGQYPVSFLRLAAGARGVVALELADPIPSGDADLAGGVRLWLRQEPTGVFDASFFADEPERATLTLDELVRAMEAAEAAIPAP